MIDIDKQVCHWRNSATEDRQVARELISLGRTRHGLFFAHLALEKMLKALVCQQTHDLAPRLHNLVRLAEIAEIGLDEWQKNVLAEMNVFHIEGRYSESLAPAPTLPEAQSYLGRAEEVFEWLASLLSER